MKVIDPSKLTLLQSSIPEDDAPYWDDNVVYIKTDRVVDEHIVYEALAESVNKPPAKNCTGTEALWRTIGVTNAWACVDDKISTQTVAPEGAKVITVTVPFHRCTGFALLNFRASSVRAVVTDADGEVLYDVITFTLKDVRNWWGYYYMPLEYQVDLVVTEVPVSPRATLTVTLTHESGPRLGHVVAGSVWQLGATLYSAQASLRDYSRKAVNDFGEVELVKRATARRTSLPLYVHPDDIDAVYERLSRLAGRTALWIGDNVDSGAGGHQHLTVYGWMESFRSVCAGPNEISMALDIQGLI